jgi:hypothetical protein
MVQLSLAEEVGLRSQAARAAAGAIASRVRVFVVAKATYDRVVGSKLAELGQVHDLLAMAGEDAGLAEIQAELQRLVAAAAAAGGAGVQQQVQKYCIFVYVQEERHLLLTHALQTSTLRNKDGSCGSGSHSGELGYWATSGVDPLDALGVELASVIRSAIGDLVICAWALVVGVVILTINPASPAVSSNGCQYTALPAQCKTPGSPQIHSVAMMSKCRSCSAA